MSGYDPRREALTEQWLAARRKRRARALIVPGAVVLGLIALGLVLHPAPQPGPLAIQVDPRVSSGPLVDTSALQGVLRAARSGNAVCFWVDGPNGRADIVAPVGWSANRKLQILDPRGTVLASPGQRRLFEGSPGPTRTVVGCPGSARVWNTTNIAPPSAGYDDATLPPG